MKFKGNRVFVEVDGESRPIVDKGRARMKYKLEDDRIYNPNPANLTELDGLPTGGAAFPPSYPEHASKPAAMRPVALSTPVRSASPLGTGCIVAYTDGACSGNPGPAGLGYMILFPDGRRIARGEPLGQATNNIAELTAILRVLEAIEDPASKLVVHTDSSYSLGILTKGWKAKANQTLVADIKRMLNRFSNIELRKVKGHAGVPENELVDELARRAAETQQPIGS